MPLPHALLCAQRVRAPAAAVVLDCKFDFNSTYNLDPNARSARSVRFERLLLLSYSVDVPSLTSFPRSSFARSVRFERLLLLSYSVEKASLLVGSPGTAKTTCINQFIQRFNPETTGNKTITFSSLTTPGIFQVRARILGIMTMFCGVMTMFCQHFVYGCGGRQWCSSSRQPCWRCGQAARIEPQWNTIQIL